MAFKPEGDGTYKVGIVVRRVTLTQDKDGMCFRLIDIDTRLDRPVDCDGMSIAPDLILKMHCSVPAPRREARRKQRELDLIRLRSPRIYS